jgi:integrase
MPKAVLSEVERWERNLANGSTAYAQVSARRLRAFCREREVEPDALASMEPKPLRHILEDYLVSEREKGHSGEYIRTTIKAVRSWLVHNDKELPKGLKIPNRRLHPRIADETALTTEDLRKVLLAANSYERVAVGFVAFAGLRIGVLGNQDGSDGLRVSDLPEILIDGQRVSFAKVPAMVKVRAVNSKEDNEHVSFIGPEMCRYVKENLEERIRKGEKVDGSTDLISPVKAGKQFMTAINVGDRIRRPMRATGVAARPYAWRSYFIQTCLVAQSRSERNVPDRFVEHWVGHVGDISDKHYGTGKGSAALVEEMREAYSRCVPFLETALGEKMDKTRETRRELGKLLAEVLGRSDPTRVLTIGELAELVKEVESAPAEPKTGGRRADVAESLGATRVPQSPKREKIVVAADDPAALGRYVADGWDVEKLNDRVAYLVRETSYPLASTR